MFFIQRAAKLRTRHRARTYTLSFTVSKFRRLTENVSKRLDGVLEARLGVLEDGLGVLEAGLGVLEAGLGRLGGWTGRLEGRTGRLGGRTGHLGGRTRHLGGRTGCLGGWTGCLGAIQASPEAPESAERLTGSVGKRNIWIFKAFGRFLGGPQGRAWTRHPDRTLARTPDTS